VNDEITLRDLEHLDEKFTDQIAALRREWTQYNRLVELAIDKAKISLDAELLKLNNLRREVIEDRQDFPTKPEMSQASEKIRALEQWSANLTGKMWAVGALVVILSLGITFAGLFLHP
jgi:hypothetical protein